MSRGKIKSVKVTVFENIEDGFQAVMEQRVCRTLLPVRNARNK
jgi:hypothetical protein